MTAYPPPGRNPPDPDVRVQVQTRRAFGGGQDGGSRWALPVTNTDPIASPYVRRAVAVVHHWDDPTVERPDAEWVLWCGVTDPYDAEAFDGRIRANV